MNQTFHFSLMLFQQIEQLFRTLSGICSDHDLHDGILLPIFYCQIRFRPDRSQSIKRLRNSGDGISHCSKRPKRRYRNRAMTSYTRSRSTGGNSPATRSAFQGQPSSPATNRAALLFVKTQPCGVRKFAKTQNEVKSSGLPPL